MARRPCLSIEQPGQVGDVSPVLLGRGEALFDGMDWRALGYRAVESVAGEKTTHLKITRTA